MRTRFDRHLGEHIGSPLLVFVFVLAMGCGANELPNGNDAGVADDGGPSGDAGVVVKDFWPLAAGNWWTYEDLDTPGTFATDTLSGPVPTPDDPEGRSAFLLTRTHSDDPGDVHRTYMEIQDGRVLRYRKEWDATGLLDQVKVYDPSFLQLDLTKLEAGDAWQATFVRSDYDGSGNLIEEKNKAYQYEVETIDDPQTVAGESLPCVRILRTDLMDGDTKTFWFAEHVGKVRETGVKSGTEEENQEMLVDYEVE